MENKEININIDDEVLVQVLDKLIEELKGIPKEPKHVHGMKWGIRKK